MVNWLISATDAVFDQIVGGRQLKKELMNTDFN
ncbi:MAG: hypothetical protein K0R59_3369 [Sphingobacterium sp.]|jgi:hypothetical protein|nr:hypothetical protein [Sphingobacterium sp.]